MSSLTAENISLLLLELLLFWHNIQNMIVILENWSYKILHKCLCKLIKIKTKLFFIWDFFHVWETPSHWRELYKNLPLGKRFLCGDNKTWRVTVQQLNTLTSTLENCKNEHLCAIFNFEFSYAHHWGGNKVSKMDVPLNNA